jgi:lysophospholipase L1-like esterase
VDKLIPASFSSAGIDALNSRIPAWAAGLNSTDSPIVLADCSREAGYTLNMLRDGVHPNDQGDQFIAKAVGPLVVQAVKDVIASRELEE